MVRAPRRPRRRAREEGDALLRRFAVLLVVSVLTVLAVGAASVTVTRRADASGRQTDAANRLQSFEQDADMMHDALRSDVLAAVSADTRAKRLQAVSDAVEHQKRVDDNMTAAVAVLENDLTWPDLEGRLRTAASDLRQYADDAVSLTRSVAEAESPEADPAVARELARFEASFSRAEESQGDVVDRIRVRVEEARARDAASSRTATALVTGTAALGVALLLALGLYVFGEVRSMMRAKSAADARTSALAEQSRREAARHSFSVELHDGFEAVSTEEDAYATVGRALDVIDAEGAGELLAADSSNAHLARVATSSAGAPGCTVTSPHECIAVRRGSRTHFDSSESLGGCPRLRDRPSGPVSADCVPVAFMGRAIGVLHVTGPEGEPSDPERAHRLAALADQAGARIGTLRAFAQAQVQASTDGLTGLLNRRSLEDQVRQLGETGVTYSVVMADLDHFKKLNDTYGHDAGDRALRTFAAVVRQTVRSDDLACRFGGEEFVLVLPEVKADRAVTVVDRLRERLAAAVANGSLPPVTVSAGVADTREGGEFSSLLAAADTRLLEAKRSGRDRVVGPAADPAQAEVGVGAADPSESADDTAEDGAADIARRSTAPAA